MSQNLQLALLVILIIALYIISSRWRPEDQEQRSMRVSYWIGLAIALVILVFITISRMRHA